jgi:hypothetical protein
VRARSSGSTSCGGTTRRPWCGTRAGTFSPTTSRTSSRRRSSSPGGASTRCAPWAAVAAGRRPARQRERAARPPAARRARREGHRRARRRPGLAGRRSRRRGDRRAAAAAPRPPPLLPPAVATEGSITGSITCATGYVSAIAPGDVAVRLLPDRLPSGWSYAQIFARENPTARCVPPSLTALRADATGLVTGRISVTGPVDARIDQGKLTARTVPDTVFGYAARRFDDTVDVPVHRWVWSDEQGRQWSAEVSGMPLAEARQALAAVSIDGPRIAWDPAAAPGWTLVHLREGAPYSGPPASPPGGSR